LFIVYVNRRTYSNLTNENAGKAPRKEVQCSFRLLNVLFSDTFASDFAALGDVANRQLLDSGKAGNDEHFWVRVQDEYVSTNNDYGLLLFDDDEILSAQDHIDPSKILNHQWKKLRHIWKAINADYKAALTRCTLSGTHESSFYDFTNGKLDVYYLRKWLQAKPHLNDMVEADLPEEVSISSDMISLTSESQKSASKRRRGGGTNEIAAAIRAVGDAKMRTEVAKQKIAVMTEENNRRKEEHQDSKRQRLFEEWEKIQTNLRTIRDDLRNNDLDDDERDDLKADATSLRKRKNLVANESGLDRGTG
jgi:hypothetical protein